MTRNILILAIFLPFLAHALESNRVAVDTGNKLSMHKSNNINIKEIEEHDASISNRFDKYRTCIEKDKVYLGPGASNVDADYCYNLNNTTAGQFRPYLAGMLTSVGRVSFYSGSSYYRSNMIGRFAADIRCNAQYSGSRALVYDDLKYVMDDLSQSSIINSYPRIWVYDTTLNFFGGTNTYDNVTMSNNEFITKSGHYALGLNNCNGWKGADSNYKGSALIRQSSGGYLYEMSFTTCNNYAYIACIYN